MTVESDLHIALMAQAEVMVAALGYTALWPQKGGDKPAGEHVTIYHLPNDNEASDLSTQVLDRQGFLIITLVSDLGEYEAVTKAKTGAIAAYFKRGLRLTSNDATVTITMTTVRPGSEKGQRWETPIWISYWSMS